MEEIIDAYHGNVAHDLHDATLTFKTMNGVKAHNRRRGVGGRGGGGNLGSFMTCVTITTKCVSFNFEFQF
jgi:hypothetical protein